MKDIFLQNVLSTIRRYDMISPQDKVLVAVSGGPDSVCLLHTLIMLQEVLACSLKVIHIDHGLRKESAEEAQFVSRLCQHFDLECVVRKVDVDARVDKSRDSVEMAARHLRYQAFYEELKKSRFHKLALGHTADDQVETMLMRVIKGTGTPGLAGIFPKREVLIRPLLESWRHSIEKYCLDNSLPTMTDQSNFSEVYFRNRVRNSLLPLLEKEYNPRIKDALFRLAEIIREESIYLDKLAEEAFYSKAISGEIGEGYAKMKGRALGELPLALARRVFRYAYVTSTNQLPPSFERMEAAFILCRKGARSGAVIQLGKNTSVRKNGIWLEIYIEDRDL